MTLKYVRIVRRGDHHEYDSGHHEWNCFTIQRIVIDPGSMSLAILKDMKGRGTMAPLCCIAKYPEIVQITTEMPGFDSCTTFDVEFTRAWREGTVCAREPESGIFIDIPFAILEEALFHRCRQDPLAV